MTDIPEPPKREQYGTKGAYKAALKHYEKQIQSASIQTKVPLQRLAEIEKRVEKMDRMWTVAVAAIGGDIGDIKKALEDSGLQPSQSGLIKVAPGLRSRGTPMLNRIVWWIKGLKWFWQRGRRGWADCDTWSFDNYLAGV